MYDRTDSDDGDGRMLLISLLPFFWTALEWALSNGVPLRDSMLLTHAGLLPANGQPLRGCMEHWMLPFQISIDQPIVSYNQIRSGARGEAGFLLAGVR